MNELTPAGVKPRSHTMKALKALQSLQEKRSLPLL